MERQLLGYANAVLFTLAALLPIVNPFGSAPIFLSLTADLPGSARRKLAVVVGRYAFLLLVAAMLIGSHVLRLFGVSLPIVRVAGGLLVTANGWRLLNDDARPSSDPRPVDAWEREVARRAFYPLTFPLTVGPGSISIAITLGARATGRGGWSTGELAADLVGVLIVALTVFLSSGSRPGWFCTWAKRARWCSCGCRRSSSCASASASSGAASWTWCSRS